MAINCVKLLIKTATRPKKLLGLHDKYSKKKYFYNRLNDVANIIKVDLPISMEKVGVQAMYLLYYF